jgi:hypothetical protein
MACVCVDFHREGGIYRSEWDLHRLGEVGLASGGGRPASQATWLTGQVVQLPPTRASPTCVDTWQPSFGLNCLKSRLAGQGVRPGVWPTRSTCQIHPRGDNDFDIWSTSLCYPLKCSNLVPKFLKLNKH